MANGMRAVIFLQLSFVMSNLSGATAKNTLSHYRLLAWIPVVGLPFSETISTYNTVVWSPVKFAPIAISGCGLCDLVKLSLMKYIKRQWNGDWHGKLQNRTEVNRVDEFMLQANTWGKWGEIWAHFYCSLYANDQFLMDFCDNILLHTQQTRAQASKHLWCTEPTS